MYTLSVEDFSHENVNQALSNFMRGDEYMTDSDAAILTAFASNFPPSDDINLFGDLLLGLSYELNGDLEDILASAQETFKHVAPEDNSFSSEDSAKAAAASISHSHVIVICGLDNTIWRVATVERR